MEPKKTGLPPVEFILQFFAYTHLPPHLQVISKPFAELAYVIANQSNNPETTAALRKLLESKDCAVRAFIYNQQEVQNG